MKLNLRNLVLSSAVLCASTAFAAETRLDVPFDFTVKNHAYHAGSYRVEIDPTGSMVKLSSINLSSQPVMWIVSPGNSLPQAKVRLTFDVVGKDHMLRTIQYGALVTPDLDKRPNGVERTTIIGE